MVATAERGAEARAWPRGIGAITLFVEDIEAAKRFYREVFGLPVAFEDDASAVFDFGNTIINLLTAAAAQELIAPAAVARRAAGSRLQLTIQVEDVDATCAELATRGVELLNGPLDRPWGVRTASFRDPDGHIWEIAQSWRSDRQPGAAHDTTEDAMAQPTPDRERTTLLATLSAQRAHVLGILEGLDEEALRRPVLPSGWTCLGLVQHLALDVERFWFRGVVVGEQTVIDELAAAPDDAWHVGPDVPAADVLNLYRQEIDRANALITATLLDAAPAWWPGDLFGDFRLHNLREIMLHVITETACHAGHLDAARELIDGRRWLVLTE